MKKLISLLALLAAGCASAQFVTPVTKNQSNEVQSNLVIPNGRTLTATGTGQIVATHFGGTIEISNVDGLQDALDGKLPLTGGTLSGNLLLGTSTDSGNGRLQLASHSTNSGGIGFGTSSREVIYRTGSDALRTQSLYQIIRANGTDAAFNAATDSHTVPNFQIAANGFVEWGSGSATRDVNLFRGGTDLLSTNDELQSRRISDALGAFSGSVTGDSVARWMVLTNGRMEWGTGSGARDTFLYRGGVALLQTVGEFRAERGSSTLAALSAWTIGDSAQRFSVMASGQLEWGSGAASRDTFLYRAAADVLQTDGNFRSLQSNASDVSFSTRVSSDTFNRFQELADGQHEWGTGSGAADTNLYRSAANTLKTDDALVVGGTITAGSAPTTLTDSAGKVLSAALNTVAIAQGGTGATDAASAFTALKQAATESATGVVELATTAEAVTGTDTTRAVTPAGLKAATDALTFPLDVSGTPTAGQVAVWTDADTIEGAGGATTLVLQATNGGSDFATLMLSNTGAASLEASNDDVTIEANGAGAVIIQSVNSGVAIQSGGSGDITFTASGSGDITLQANNGGAVTIAAANVDATISAGASGTLRLQHDGTDAIEITAATSSGITFSQYGAGSLETDASGVVTATSDGRLKNVQGQFDRGLPAVISIDPVLYEWKRDPGVTYAGFIAQNVQAAIPEAVWEGPDGFLTLSDRPIIAALVNATQELHRRQVATDIALGVNFILLVFTLLLRRR